MPVVESAGVLLIACVNAANYKLFGTEILSVCTVFGTAGSLSQLAFSENSVLGMNHIKGESEPF